MLETWADLVFELKKKTQKWGEKKPINSKHINIFLTALAGQSFQDEPPPVPGTNGTKWRFDCGIKQERAGLSQGQVPVCPRERSHLSQGRFLFVPDTVPPKTFMFIGFFFSEKKPKNIGVAPPPLLSREVSHRNLGLQRCRATRGCRSYSCGCCATMCN